MSDTRSMAVKFVDGRDDLIEGPLAPFYGLEAMKGRDFDGEYFDADTDFMLDWFGDWERPLLYAHGFDPAIKAVPVGRIKVEKRDKELWMQAQLDKAHEYYEELKQLVGEAAVGFSSGAVDHLAVTEAGGRIKQWPLVEGSLVPNPSNPLAVPHHAVKAAELPEEIQRVVAIKAEPTEPAEAVDEDDPSVDHHVDEDGVEWTTKEASTETPEPAPDINETITAAVKAALSPQSLHDAAVANGAQCSSEHVPQPPALKLAIRSVKAAETPAETPDLDGIAARMREHAIKEARNLIDPR